MSNTNGKQSKKIALFVPNLTGGGAERVMLHLACGLAEAGRDVDLVLSHAEGPFLTDVPANVRVVDLKTPQPLLSFRPLAGYLRTEQPSVLLSALNQANIAALWAKRLARSQTRIVISIHNTLSVEGKNGTSWKLKMMPAFAKRFYPLADDIVAVSHGAADDLARLTGLARERIQVIYNPVVSPDLWRKAALPVSHPWLTGDETQTPVILAVGRLTAQKDYPTLLRAFALVRKQRPARLLILGEGEDRPALESLTKELHIADDVQMPGFVDNPFAFMRQARVLALSSRWEGLPTVLIEALACGTPIVSTDCPSGPNEILAGGKWGPLVPMSDPQALAYALLAELAKPKQTPPDASWQPYLRETSTCQYMELLSA